MVVEFGADFVPVVFLTADNVDIGENDAVVVEGQEDITGETVEEEVTADGEEAVEGEETVGEDVVVEGEDAVAEDAAAEGEEAVEGDVLPEEELLGSGAAYEDEMAMEGIDMTGEEVQPAKDPLLSSPVFVGGVSLGVLVVGGVLGFLLARRKIKKGIEIYEDI